MLEGYECNRCNHRWMKRSTTEGEPVICPSCKSAYWNRPKKGAAVAVMTEEQEAEAGKEMLWNLFVTQFIVGWKGIFPRGSSAGNYIKPEELDWLETLGKRIAPQMLRDSVNAVPAKKEEP